MRNQNIEMDLEEDDNDIFKKPMRTSKKIPASSNESTEENDNNIKLMK